MIEIGKSSHDPVVAQAGVLSGHFDDQVCDLFRKGRPPRTATMLRTVELLRDESAVPGEDR
jgi:hypothetical protein